MKLWVAGAPQQKGSKVAFVHPATGRAMLKDANKNAKAWQKHVRTLAMQANVPALMEGPVALDLHFFMPKPKGNNGTPRDRRGFPCCTPDWDKLARTVGDALSGVAYKDDEQVVKATVELDYGPPGVHIEVRPVPCRHKGGLMRGGRCRDCGDVLE